MNNVLNQLSQDELMRKYLDALQEIQYLEHMVHSLDDQLEIWQKAWEDQHDILVAHDLI